MRVKTYLRIATRKGARPIVDARATPSQSPLTQRGEPLPTVAFAIELNIPDAMFKRAEQVIATVDVPESAARVIADVSIAAEPQEGGEHA